jgi:hypothetical protein
MNKTIYKSPKGYKTLMAFYEANLERWPVPYECLTVPTRHGETHLIASGPPDAPDRVNRIVPMCAEGIARSALSSSCA